MTIKNKVRLKLSSIPGKIYKNLLTILDPRIAYHGKTVWVITEKTNSDCVTNLRPGPVTGCAIHHNDVRWLS